MKQEGRPNDLLTRLKSDDAFAKADLNRALDPMLYVGRSVQQVDEFVKHTIDPIRQRYTGKLERKVQIKV